MFVSAGFMTTGDSNAPGNYGLLDVVAALHWIKDNIGAFGGDPKKITMMGQGYGAAIVNLLMISPVTKGELFLLLLLFFVYLFLFVFFLSLFFNQIFPYSNCFEFSFKLLSFHVNSSSI